MATIDFYKDVLESPSGLIESVEGENLKFHAEMQTFYQLGFATRGADKDEKERYSITPSGVRYARARVTMDKMSRAMKMMLDSYK